MNSNLPLALRVRDVCLKHKTEYAIKINGQVELEAYKDIPVGDDFYYQLSAKIRSDEEADRLDYYLRYKKAPD